jgi:hypothetical protein
MFTNIFATFFIALSLAGSIYYSAYYSKSGSSWETKNPYSRSPASIGLNDKISEQYRDTKGAPESVESYSSNLEVLKECFDEKKCHMFNDGFYDISLSRTVRNELVSFYEYVLKNQIKSQKIERLARLFMEVNNSQIKEKALLLLSTQHPSQENLQSIIRNILDKNDPNLVGLAIMELEKYKGHEKYRTVIKNIPKESTIGPRVEAALDTGTVKTRF